MTVVMSGLCLCLSLYMAGCWWDTCSEPSGGFNVWAWNEYGMNCTNNPACSSPTGPKPVPLTTPASSGVQVSGDEQCDISECPNPILGGAVPSYGSVYHFGLASANDPPAYTIAYNPNNPTAAYGYLVVTNGRTPAQWTGTVINWDGPPCYNYAMPFSTTFVLTSFNPDMSWTCFDLGAGNTVIAPGPMIVSGGTPSSLTISNPDYALTTSGGMPELLTFDSNGINTEDDTESSSPSCGLEVTVEPPPVAGPDIATAVSSNGTSATFPFPTFGDGSALPPGFYTFNVMNQISSGNFAYQGMGVFALGSNNTYYTTPYGIDVANVSQFIRTCVPGPISSDEPVSLVEPASTTCTMSTQSFIAPILTLSSLNEVSFQGGVVGVGSEPIALKAYAIASNTQTGTNGSYVKTTEPTRAIVANFGSGTVSIVNLYSMVVNATIAVGSEPSAIVLDNNQAYAYVANYGSASVSQINLSSNTVSATIGVGANPDALAMDPSGTALWVGGYNYVDKISLSNFSVLQSYSVPGQVTSLAVSAGQNQFVATTMATSGTSKTFQANVADITSGASKGTYAQYTLTTSARDTAYAEIKTSGGSASGAPGWLMTSGALVSANYGNSIVVVGTPSGFAVVDLIRQLTLVEGTTPSSVRGIATDPAEGVAFLTVPDSNSLISVPLPVQHTNAQVTVSINGGEQTVSVSGQSVPDSGTVYVQVADAIVSASYGQGDTAATVASKLATAISLYGVRSVSQAFALGFPVTAQVNGSVLTLTANKFGPAANSWPVLTSCRSNYAQYGVGCSFSASPSGTTLSGAQ